MTAAASTVRVGLVGFGSIARVHAQVIRHRTDVQVTAVVTRAAPTLPTEVRRHDTLAGMLQAGVIDLAVLCTPSGMHAAQAWQCLEANTPVVVEKPLSLDPGAGRRVVDEAERRGLLLTVISQRRFEPGARAVKDVIASGVLGRPILGEALVRWSRSQAYYDDVDWRGTRDLDGGALMNQGIHVVDLLRWFFGDVAAVQGQVATLARNIEAEDTAVACLHFASGALGVVSATTAAASGLPAEINLFFERGSVALSDDRIVRWNVPGVDPPGFEPDPGSGSQAAQNITPIGHTRQWEDIMAAFRGGRAPAVTGSDALGTVSVIDAIQRSAASADPRKHSPR
jgi:UDP-N-acetyl-2-amino-2-deoxyglucuronate dehydrogenase